jgi:hypothetical protein
MVNLVNFLFDVEGNKIESCVRFQLKNFVSAVFVSPDMAYKNETAGILINKLLKETGLKKETESKKNISFCMTILSDETFGQITISLSYKGVTSKVGYQR